MTARRRGAAALAAVAAGLLAWPGAAPAQNHGPIPYSQLVRTERPATPKRPKARPRPKPPTVVAPAGTTPSAVPGTIGTPQPGVAAGPLPPRTLDPSSSSAMGRSATSPPPPVGPPAPSPRAAAAPDLPSAAAPAPAASPIGARLAPGTPPPPPELEAFVDGAVREAVATRPLGGVAVAVVGGGQVLLEKGYGLARRAPATAVDPRVTVFRLGSVSKVFTWIEVLKAVEAGRLRLDEPVNARLPRALAVPDDGFRTPVRLRNLLTHDAGFESREFGRLFRPDPAGVRTLPETLAAERPHRVRPPGEMPTYSNYGAALAGFLAADAAHAPFERLVAADLLRPAGLLSTTFEEPDAGAGSPMDPGIATRLAQGFSWSRKGLRPEPFAFAGGWAPSLSASSTADDMARFMLAFLAGGRAPGVGTPLWGPRTDAALRTPLAPGWAHGLMIYDLPGGFRGLGHDGAAPGFRAKLMVSPQLDLGVFVVAGSDTGERLVQTLPELLVRRFYAGAQGPATAVVPFDGGAYRGTYVSTRRTYHGLEGFVDRLTRLYAVRLDPMGGALTVWGPDGGRRWLATARPGRFVADDGTGAPLDFLFDHNGRPRAFLDPGGQWGAERVDPLHRPATLLAAAVLAEAAALLTLAGLFVRDAREYRQTRRQATASRVQSLAALLWLVAAGLFATFTAKASAGGLGWRGWPDPWLIGASACALAAALLTLVQLGQLPGSWSGERRIQGWSAGRRLRHTLTVFLSAAFAFVLLGWGALEPWSS